MNRYECNKCGRPVVVNERKDQIEQPCCQGETPVKFTRVNAKTIVAVTKMPEDPKNLKPLPPSVPLPPLKPATPVITPAKK